MSDYRQMEQRGSGDSRSMTDEARDRAGRTAEQARERAGQAADQAKDQAERGRTQVAERTESMADSLRDQAEGRGGVQEKMGTRAADAMERTAGYLRENRTEEIWGDLEQMARNHPMQTLGGAVVAGFIVGRILR